MRCTLSSATITRFAVCIFCNPHILPCQVNTMIELEIVGILVQCFLVVFNRFETIVYICLIELAKQPLIQKTSHIISMGIRQTCKSQLISPRENGTKLLAFTIELMSESRTYSRRFVIVYWENAFWNASSLQSNRGKLNHQHYKQQKISSFEEPCCLLTKNLLGKVLLDIQVLYNVFHPVMKKHWIQWVP
jgi:hypothetical protein